mmetsp:Transcript_106190/g.193211  ORF Transcript_106190/g.193211 Transcript_106190/m.193211 type:complete len:337 (-) Transcript_106190:55-1065(-)
MPAAITACFINLLIAPALVCTISETADRSLVRRAARHEATSKTDLRDQSGERRLENAVESTVATERSLSLSKVFTAAAAEMDNNATKHFFGSFKICGRCDSFKRFGETNDGGYLMCMDSLKPGTIKAAYSLGVRDHDQWSVDVAADLEVPVNQFDCTVQKTANQCKGCWFFKKCIVSADGKHPVADGWGLQQALSETGQGSATAGSLLMKMDIEGSEWPVFASARLQVLKKFNQLIVEFHNLEDEGKHGEYLQAMQRILSSGLKVAHLHGNNCVNNIGPESNKMYRFGDFSIPKIVEVTFVRADARANGCLDNQVYDALDAPNGGSNPELPMAHLR